MEPTPATDLTTMHLARAAEGDTGSLGWVVGRLSPLLRSQAAYRLGPALRRHVDPDDLVQEAWLVALPRLRSLCRSEGRRTPVLLRFLSSTIVNHVQNLARKRLRRAPGGTADVDVDRRPAEATEVVTRLVRAEASAAVVAALDELPDDARRVVLLRGVEQLPSRTVATMLGVSPGAVAMRYQRALRSLRERLPGSVFDELDDG